LVDVEEKIVQLAALLHDIGKFWQGTGEKGKHPELSGKFIKAHVPEQWQEAAGLVVLHHEPSARRVQEYRALKVIVCADWLSSGERKELAEEEEKGELQKYTWCIPSAVGKAKTDVSLFDHLKTLSSPLSLSLY